MLNPLVHSQVYTELTPMAQRVPLTLKKMKFDNNRGQSKTQFGSTITLNFIRSSLSNLDRGITGEN